MSRGKYNALEKLTILEELSNGEIGFLAAAMNAMKYGDLLPRGFLIKLYKTYDFTVNYFFASPLKPQGFIQVSSN